uniref:Uncharacterized protein n=1 Tax=Rhizophora mucronata TaxID=61149 RepID=A0A2P2IU15_RHIMU
MFKHFAFHVCYKVKEEIIPRAYLSTFTFVPFKRKLQRQRNMECTLLN